MIGGGLRREVIEKTDFGLHIMIWKAKTNQEGFSESEDVLKAVKGVNLK